MFPELRKLQYLRRLEYLKLWILEERRARADLIEVYKIIAYMEYHQSHLTRSSNSTACLWNNKRSLTEADEKESVA